jgi:hypothetical protein
VTVRRGHEFPYAPVPTSASDDDGEGLDLVVATRTAVDPSAIARALVAVAGETVTETVLAHAPLFWTHVLTTLGCRRSDAEAALRVAGVPVRYVASARRASLVVPPALDFEGVTKLRATSWRQYRGEDPPPDPVSEGRWFLRDEPGGLAVDRARCGIGRGTRLAVIDDDAADFEQLDLDDTVRIGIDELSCGSGHGALMIGWAVGARTHEGTRFAGVAPGASVRAYAIPRPGDDALSLPLALARSAIDGADVIVCATYVEGTTSPMLDDALELASRRGRRGRGCIVILPTGRETSSPYESVHASLSLALDAPASDPRIFCVAPGGRRGGWFLWREQHGRLRPFANRGPAVRWLAPGDDIAYPFLAKERMFHAESSGAAALAAGVSLLVVANNPGLRASDVFTLLARCATPAEALPDDTMSSLVDRADALPLGRDRDGHDAKHGYGRIDATRACLAAGDPVCLELVSMGEDAAAKAWADARTSDPVARKIYDRRMARWAVRVLLGDADLEHGARALLRHVRLLASDAKRRAHHAPGAVSRHLAIVVRKIASEQGATRAIRPSIERLAMAARRLTEGGDAGEALLWPLAQRVFAPEGPHRPASAWLHTN